MSFLLKKLHCLMNLFVGLYEIYYWLIDIVIKLNYIMLTSTTLVWSFVSGADDHQDKCTNKYTKAQNESEEKKVRLFW